MYAKNNWLSNAHLPNTANAIFIMELMSFEQLTHDSMNI